MQRLTKEQGATILLVAHDNRILIADRIINMEDGCLLDHGLDTVASRASSLQPDFSMTTAGPCPDDLYGAERVIRYLTDQDSSLSDEQES
jgi:ABC-type cobalamin/Fe3+-siderophores transport system ATPase subunit